MHVASSFDDSSSNTRPRYTHMDNNSYNRDRITGSQWFVAVRAAYDSGETNSAANWIHPRAGPRLHDSHSLLQHTHLPTRRRRVFPSRALLYLPSCPPRRRDDRRPALSSVYSISPHHIVALLTPLIPSLASSIPWPAVSFNAESRLLTPKQSAHTHLPISLFTLRLPTALLLCDSI